MFSAYFLWAGEEILACGSSVISLEICLCNAIKASVDAANKAMSLRCLSLSRLPSAVAGLKKFWIALQIALGKDKLWAVSWVCMEILNINY
mgnify:CR=1 FL=1